MQIFSPLRVFWSKTNSGLPANLPPTLTGSSARYNYSDGKMWLVLALEPGEANKEATAKCSINYPEGHSEVGCKLVIFRNDRSLLGIGTQFRDHSLAGQWHELALLVVCMIRQTYSSLLFNSATIGTKAHIEVTPAAKLGALKCSWRHVQVS